MNKQAAPHNAPGRSAADPGRNGEGPADADGSFDLRFTPTRDTVQGVLAMVQEWALARNITRTDQSGLRLVLEELLLNLCFHAGLDDAREQAPQTELFLGTRPPFSEPEEEEELWQTRGEQRLFLRLRDLGRPFNPLEHTPAPLGARSSDTAAGGRGLFFVRLLSAHAAYSRKEGTNILSLVLPLSEKEEEEESGRDIPQGCEGARSRLRERGLWALWRSQLALRQAVFLGCIAAVAVWGSIFALHLYVNAERRDAAMAAGGKAADETASALSRLLPLPEEKKAARLLARWPSPFPDSGIFLLNQDGGYVFPPRGLGGWASSTGLRADARVSANAALDALERAMLRGEAGSMRISPAATGAKAARIPLFESPAEVFYRPLPGRGLYLGYVVPARQLGCDPLPLPWGLWALALCGPLCFGLLVHRAAVRVLRPMGDLADSVERMTQGAEETLRPLSFNDSGNLLPSFERALQAFQAALRTLVLKTTAQERLAHELAVASAMQKSILPSEFPVLAGVDVYASTDMAHEVCGDLHDCFVMSSPDGGQRLCCVVGDVSGKGLPAALLMGGAMSLARAALLEGLGPAEALSWVNTALFRNNGASMFVTMLAGVMDPATGLFSWASAGHPPPIQALPGHMPDAEKARAFSWPEELPLGIRERTEYSAFTHALSPGEALLVYTDGASEAAAAPGTDKKDGAAAFFGEEGLAASLAANLAAKDARALLEAVRAAIFAHMGDASPQDDITLMVLRRDQCPIYGHMR